MGQTGHCRAVKLLRLEMLMQQLVVEYSDFDELVERFDMELSDIRGRGYCRAEKHRSLSRRIAGHRAQQRRSRRLI